MATTDRTSYQRWEEVADAEKTSQRWEVISDHEARHVD
jgi:hypothetical protein